MSPTGAYAQVFERINPSVRQAVKKIQAAEQAEQERRIQEQLERDFPQWVKAQREEQAERAKQGQTDKVFSPRTQTQPTYAFYCREGRG